MWFAKRIFGNMIKEKDSEQGESDSISGESPRIFEIEKSPDEIKKDRSKSEEKGYTFLKKEKDSRSKSLKEKVYEETEEQDEEKEAKEKADRKEDTLCKECNAKLSEGAKFCANWGTKT